PLDNISHGAVGTGGCSPITQPVSAPVATVSLNWVTSPAGLQVSINGQVRTTPYSQTFVVGSTVSLNVPTPQTSNGASFIYSNGSLGTSLTVPSANTTYTASFLSTAASVVVAPIVSGAVYSIIAKHSGKALSVYSSSKDDGGGIVQWSADGSVDQKWVLTKLSNGYYSIKSVVNSKAMDVYNNSTSDGAPVLQWTPNTQDNQQYKLVDAGGGYYYIVARYSLKYLHMRGNTQLNGAILVQWTKTGLDNQKFRFNPQVVASPAATVSLNWVTSPAGLQVSINGQVRTTPYSQTFVVGSTVSLNVPTPQTSNGASFIYSNGSLGTSLTVPSANTTYTASFLSTAASVVVAPIVSGAVYSIIAKHSGKALSVYSSSKDDGGGIVQWSADGSVDQKWVLTKLSNGYYSIKSVVNSKAMDVYNNSTSDGAPVLQWTPNTQDNQQYKLVDAGGGYYSLVARHSQKYLAIEGSSQNEGAWLQQWPGSGDDNQKFRFTPQGSGRLEALRNEESGFEPSVAVYPNPGVDRVRVSGTGGGAVRLVDVQGRFQLEVASVGDVAEMDVSGLSPGVYLVQIHRGERLISRKLIVNH
ncbi:RICIN domain-containing protein, partial [Spirosoma utsteinense]